MAEALLHTGEYGLVVTGLDIDYAIGSQTSLSKRRGKEIWSRNAPKNLAPRTRRYSCSE